MPGKIKAGSLALVSDTLTFNWVSKFPMLFRYYFENKTVVFSMGWEFYGNDVFD